ncbi:MAG: hypothetical protein M0Q92_07655 [Methanoregula sp.]|jgi:hypothetical protein|nr:hypothetical protein [Methanoregula sp.]
MSLQPKERNIYIAVALVIGVILLIDVVNVFLIGGPSFFSLILGQGSATAVSGSGSLAGNTQQPAGDKIPASSGQAIFVPTKATPVPTVRYVSVVTPVTTPDPGQSSLRYIPPTTQAAPEESYALIYSDDLSYLAGEDPTAVAFDVKVPPLVIRYNVSPLIVTDSKMTINRSSKSELRTDILINYTYPSPDSEFTVTVFDKNSGRKLSDDGFGREFGMLTPKTFIVREAGSFIIQFDGDDAEAHVDMLLKNEGNIV